MHRRGGRSGRDELQIEQKVLDLLVSRSGEMENMSFGLLELRLDSSESLDF